MTGSDRERVEALAEVLRRADDEALVRTNFGQILADYDEAARAVLASDWLAARDKAIAAKAWDEGRAAGHAERRPVNAFGDTEAARNPYRDEAENA